MKHELHNWTVEQAMDSLAVTVSAAAIRLHLEPFRTEGKEAMETSLTSEWCRG